MSKLFKQARRVQVHDGTGGISGVIQKLDTTIAEAEMAADVSEIRLQNCEEFTLGISGEPLITNWRQPTQLATEAYCGLRTRLMRLQTLNGFRSLLISSAASDEGKTLTAINIALCCTQLPKTRVLLIDSDIRTQGLTRRLQLPEVPGVADVLAGKAAFEEVIRATENKHLYVVTAGMAASPPAELFSGPRWKDFLGWCAETFKIILVDAPPIIPLADFELISAGCDGLLIVVRALQTKRELLQKAKSRIDQKKLVGIIFNATDSPAGQKYYSHYVQRGTKRTATR